MMPRTARADTLTVMCLEAAIAEQARRELAQEAAVEALRKSLARFSSRNPENPSPRTP